MEPEQFLIWASDRQMWWMPEGKGYTKDIAAAGRFTLADAKQMTSFEYKTKYGLFDALIVIEPNHARSHRLEPAA